MPGAKLDVYMPATAAATTALDGLRLTWDDANAIDVKPGFGLGIKFYSGNTNNATGSTETAAISSYKEVDADDNLATALTFSTHNGTANAERMRITSAGNIGIGTTSPATKLDVVGGVKLGNEATCDSSRAGTIRWTGSAFQGCNGSAWVSLGGGLTSCRICYVNPEVGEVCSAYSSGNVQQTAYAFGASPWVSSISIQCQ